MMARPTPDDVRTELDRAVDSAESRGYDVPMSHAHELPPRPTYADIEALPAHVVGEILGGELFASPRPAVPHAQASSRLGTLLGGPFDLGLDGPGGWHIVDEPELSLGVDPDFDPVVPDLAGWRVETLPELPDAARMTVNPQWVCEILSPRTRRTDRVLKLPFYARAGVDHAWLVDPAAETLEVYARQGDTWLLAGSHSSDDVVRAVPFDAVPLSLSWLWGRRPTEP